MTSVPAGDVISSPQSPSSVLFAVRKGDRESCQWLIEQWQPVIEIIASRYASNQLMLDEMTQAGRIAIRKAAFRFDETVGVPFGHYAKRSVRNACLDLIAASGSDSSEARVSTELAEDCDFRRPLLGCPLDRLIGYEAISIVREFVAALPQELQSIFHEIYVLGRSQRDVADGLGVSQPRIAHLHKQLKQMGAKLLASYN